MRARPRAPPLPLRVLAAAAAGAPAAAVRRSVLLLTVDDLRPQLAGAYGMPGMITPAMDALAASGTVFLRAYAQVAVCSPSRNSFMSGRRPDTTRVWNFLDHFRAPGVGENWTAMPEYFKRHGYLTYGAGKLYHPSTPPDNDFPESWTVDEYNPFYWGNGPPVGDAGHCTPAEAGVDYPIRDWSPANASLVCTVNASAADDEYDHRVASRAIASLRRAGGLAAPFFVAAGFIRPHLDWRVPRRYWDMYEGVDIPLAKHQTIGDNITELEYEHNSWIGVKGFTRDGVHVYRESPQGPPLPAELQRAFRRAYYASVSFLDAEVGRVLAALDDLGLAARTAVLLHSDHGWKLGEHGDWSKCTNWEHDARVPLIVRAPWIPTAAGARTLALAELVDLYPTLAELAGLPAPPGGLEGASLVPVLHDPACAEPYCRNRTAAFSQFPRCTQYAPTVPGKYQCLYVRKEEIALMGYSIRVADARYTEWRTWRGAELAADWSAAGLVARELYDHAGDPGMGPTAFDDYEFVNMAYHEAEQPRARALAARLRRQFARTV